MKKELKSKCCGADCIEQDDGTFHTEKVCFNCEKPFVAEEKKKVLCSNRNGGFCEYDFDNKCNFCGLWTKNSTPPEVAKEEKCGVYTPDYDNKNRCSTHTEDIYCPIHSTSEPFNRFHGKCHWCATQTHPHIKSISPIPDVYKEKIQKEYTEGKLEATESHLKDLRKLLKLN
jgi:hypothetical protein